MIENLNNQVTINKQISNQIKEITNHINNAQNNITLVINDFQNKISKLNDKLRFFIVQTEINENINTLEKEINKIKEIILASKLEILSRNILNEQEINENNITVEILPYIKNCVLYKKQTIIFVISIPNFVKENYFRTTIEKVPNKGIFLELDINISKIIVHNQKIFVNVEKKNILKNDLIPYKDQCIANLVNTKQMKCKFRKNLLEEIKVISSNIVITKNLKEILVISNCKQQNEINIKGNNIIKIENCKISIGTFIYENYQKEYYSKNLPEVERNITIEQITNEFHLQEIYFKHIDNTKHIEEIKSNSNWRWYANISVNLVVILMVVAIVFFTCMKRKVNNSNVNIQLKDLRQESKLKVGGVTSPPEQMTPFS